GGRVACGRSGTGPLPSRRQEETQRRYQSENLLVMTRRSPVVQSPIRLASWIVHAARFAKPHRSSVKVSGGAHPPVKRMGVIDEVLRRAPAPPARRGPWHPSR